MLFFTASRDVVKKYCILHFPITKVIIHKGKGRVIWITVTQVCFQSWPSLLSLFAVGPYGLSTKLLFYFSHYSPYYQNEGNSSGQKALCVWSFVLSAFKMSFVYCEMGICHKHHSGIVEGGFVFSMPLFYSLALTKEPRLLLYLELCSEHSLLCGARCMSWLISAGFRGRWPSLWQGGIW